VPVGVILLLRADYILENKVILLSVAEEYLSSVIILHNLQDITLPIFI